MTPSMQFREFIRKNPEISIEFREENNVVHVEIWNGAKTRILRRFQMDAVDQANLIAHNRDMFFPVEAVCRP